MSNRKVDFRTLAKSSRYSIIIFLLILSAGLTSVPLVVFGSHSLPVKGMSNSSINAPWAFQMQNQQNTGYSPQNIVNSSNVSTLRQIWNVSLSGLTGTPVIVGGIVYLTGNGEIYAVNESSGNLIWTIEEQNISQVPSTRVGVTIDQGNVFFGTASNNLVSANALTGAINWIVPVTANITGSFKAYDGPIQTPLVYNGKVIIGETEGNLRVRGVLRAFNESNGALLWTFYTIPPAPINSTNQAGYTNPNGSLSWGTNGTTGCGCGGGAVWNVPAVDPNTGIIYFGTGEPSPSESYIRSPNDSYCNLWTDSVLGVNSTNGKLVWGYQEICDDQYDRDQGMPIQLFNTTINGQQVEVTGAGGKPGFYFELNAHTGALIYKVPVGIHLNDNNTPPHFKGPLYPDANGGINTLSSYDPMTNMVYTDANNQPLNCPSCQVNSTLYAINASTGTIVWNMNMSIIAGGVTSTNDIVFTSGNHTFYALNATTGSILWQYNDSSGDDSFRWSWGAPSVTDGMVFETTWGTDGHGFLEAFAPTNLYNINFVENGLPTGSTWSVKLSGKWYTSNTSSISIQGLSAGSYSWIVDRILSISSGTRATTSNNSGVLQVPSQLTQAVTYDIQYRVVVNPAKSGGGSTSPSGVNWYNAGIILNITANPSSGFQFTTWEISNGAQISVTNVTSASTTAVINGPGTLYAKFKAK
jgi:alcohol dehydrogenase (cytochrome c)